VSTLKLDPKTLVILFPGQGSQYAGMGQSFLDSESERDFYHQFYQAQTKGLPFNLSALCLEGPEEKLQQTAITQPAIVSYSLLLWEWMRQEFAALLQNRPLLFLGHSVGEYSALAAAGSFSANYAIQSVHHRGEFMQSAVPMGLGAMSAILKTDIDIITQACASVTALETFGIVTAANFNTREQIVISGHEQAVTEAEKLIKNAAPQARAMRLKVSAPFHSPLMKPAQEKMQAYFLETASQFSPNTQPYIANVNAELQPTQLATQHIQKLLVEQLGSSVRWCESLEQLAPLQNSLHFIECGPGKTLSGMLRKILPSAQALTLDGQDLATTKDHLKEFLCH
jgi:[acyl-carrier-protein] S-malonyltransferase